MKWWTNETHVSRVQKWYGRNSKEKNLIFQIGLPALAFVVAPLPSCSPALVDNAWRDRYNSRCENIHTHRVAGKRTFCVNNARTKRIGRIASSRTADSAISIIRNGFSRDRCSIYTSRTMPLPRVIVIRHEAAAVRPSAFY